LQGDKGRRSDERGRGRRGKVGRTTTMGIYHGEGQADEPPPRIWSGDDNVDNANSPPPHFVIYSEFQALVCLHYYAIKFTA